MEFSLLEKSEQDAKGSIVVKAAISGDTTSYLLDEFYDALKSACGISRDVSQQEVEDTILQKLSKESFKELKRDFVVNKMTSDALGLLELKPALTPKIHILEYPEVGTEYEIELSIVEKPEITLTSYDPVHVKMDEVQVTDTMVATRVAELLEGFAQYSTAAPRSVRAGDIIRVDVDTQLADKVVPHLSGKKMVLEMDSQAMPAAFLAEIIGMNVGESKKVEYDVERSRAISEDDLEHYISNVTVLEQLDKHEVELTDEWVTSNYPAVSNVKEFFEETRKDIEYDVRVMNKDTLAHLANIELEKRIIGSIPDEFYQASYKNLMDKFEGELTEVGKTLDDYYEEESTNEEELSVKMLIQSGESLKQGFALEALFDGANMSLSDDDIAEASGHFFGNAESTIEELKRAGKFELAESMAKRKKALNWLVETAVVEAED